MKPSFLALYKRGRFFRASGPIGIADDDATLRTHREQERFTAAAIAFCFEHDTKFRTHFWKSICRTSGDPRAPDSMRIEIEPPAWADLLVQSRRNGQSFAHVIECKVGAGLAPHQDPRTAAFSREDGYGQQLHDAFAGKNTKLRYIVLGYREELNLPGAHPTLPIRLGQRRWEQLAIGYPRTKLIEDLFDSLGEMGVGKFRMRKTKTIKVTRGLDKAGEAWEAIRTTIDNLGLVENYCLRDGGTNSDSTWCMGVHVLKLPKKKGVSDLHRQLQGVTWSSGEYVAWFGYVSSKGREARREIWLYCENHTRASSVKRRLKRTYTEVILDSDDDQDCVVIKDRDTPSENDVEWFERRLRTAAGLPRD